MTYKVLSYIYYVRLYKSLNSSDILITMTNNEKVGDTNLILVELCRNMIFPLCVLTHQLSRSLFNKMRRLLTTKRVKLEILTMSGVYDEL
ncbi:hypothetical protein SAMN05421807_104143 [Virgibacillus chiguensis]|uniref:Uncharacterized protein n=1 Tax=Virgibacillus chiguensis TaxID=411959 RepID=A0A1M5QHI8_9BACI|nr:hypothetical protein SAMN05421807_104143 [Virgibacillus chiguensis]